MGILELHLHEPAFNVSTGSGGPGVKGLEKASEMMGSKSGGFERSGEHEEAEEDGGGGSKGAIIALLVLVGAAVAIRRMRSGGDDVGYEHEGREEFAEVE